MDLSTIQWLYCFVFDEEKIKERKHIVKRLLKAGLHVEQFYSVQGDEIYVKIGADDIRLLEEAEIAEFTLLLDEQSLIHIAKGEDVREDVIKDRVTGEIKRTIKRHRGPLNLEKKGKRFRRDSDARESNKVQKGHNDSQLQISVLVEDEPVVEEITASKVRALQGNITPYRMFEHMYAPYNDDWQMYFQQAHGVEIYKVYKDGSILSAAARMKLLHMILERSVSPDPKTGDRGCGLSLPQLVTSEVVLSWFPLHLEATTADGERTVTTLDLDSEWATFSTLPWTQPLPLVRDYFGEKICLYFAFLGHYSLWLLAPALFGLGVFVHQMYRIIASTPNISGVDVQVDPFNLAEITIKQGNITEISIFTEVVELPYFAAFMALWATIMLEFWKRRETTLTMLWGTSDFERTESVRVEFKPKYELPSIVTGEPEVYYPWRSTMIKFAISCFVLFIAIVSVLVVVLLLTAAGALVELTTEDTETTFDSNTLQAITFGALFLDGIIKIVMGNLYEKMAQYLNDWENHRTDTKYEDNLIFKTFVFEFVNRYGTLFYLAFVKQHTDFLGVTDYCIPSLKEGNIDEQVTDNCFGTVGYALLAAFGSALIINNSSEVMIPRLKHWWNKRSNLKVPSPMATEMASDPQVEDKEPLIKSPCEDDSFMEEYESTIGDYLELAIQFGYCTMFVAAFPLAPMLAFLNNYFETWVDSHKLVSLYRRPEVAGVQDIGPWQTVFETMGLIAVFTNAGVILFSTNIVSVPENQESLRVWYFVIAVAFVFFIKWVVALAIPDIPHAVTIQLNRNEFVIRKLLMREPDDSEELDDDEAEESEFQARYERCAVIHTSDPGVKQLMARIANILNDMHSDMELKEIFSKIDGDGSGEIDGKEFLHIIRKLGHGISEYDARKLVLALDIDGDGMIDYDEFLTFMNTASAMADAESAL